MSDVLNRIVAALERMSPPQQPDAALKGPAAYVWRGGRLAAAKHFAPLPIDLIRGVEAQKTAIITNMERLARGLPAHDVLLWGARGTGKSALVKSAVGAVQASGLPLAIVDVATPTLDGLHKLFELIGSGGRAFAVFVDDLGFNSSGEARALRSLLEGGAEARPANARLFVTSNRRHLMPRDIAEQESAINRRDSVDDELALADRFGLSLGFHAVDQEGYLDIVAAYAQAFGLPFDAGEAVQWATRRGSRSGRVAWHYITDLAGRCGGQVA